MSNRSDKCPLDELSLEEINALLFEAFQLSKKPPVIIVLVPWWCPAFLSKRHGRHWIKRVIKSI